MSGELILTKLLSNEEFQYKIVAAVNQLPEEDCDFLVIDTDSLHPDNVCFVQVCVSDDKYVLELGHFEDIPDKEPCYDLGEGMRYRLYREKHDLYTPYEDVIDALHKITVEGVCPDLREWRNITAEIIGYDNRNDDWISIDGHQMSISLD